eukprot:gene17156-8693_t
MAGPEEFPYRQYAMSPMNQTLVSLTSILSMAGSLMIILSYIAWKDIQTVSRKVLVWLSICDFFIALGNICGTFFRPTMIETQDKKCIVQSFIMSAASISSFCWSVTLACCLYMTIIKNNYQLFVYLTPYFHIFNWSIGLLINTVAAEQKMLGNTHDEVTSGWCWIRHLNCSSKQHIHCSKEINWMLANYKAIEIVAYAAICFLYLLVKINLRREMKSQLQNLDTSSAVLKIAKSADRKLILLPIILVLARIPGTVRFLIFALNKTPSTLTLWAKILLVLQAIPQFLVGPNAEVADTTFDWRQKLNGHMLGTSWPTTKTKQAIAVVLGCKTKTHGYWKAFSRSPLDLSSPGPFAVGESFG